MIAVSHLEVELGLNKIAAVSKPKGHSINMSKTTVLLHNLVNQRQVVIQRNVFEEVLTYINLEKRNNLAETHVERQVSRRIQAG